MKLNITNDVTSADLEQLRKNLISYNVPHFEPVDEKPLGIFYDDDAGVRRAGLTGKLFGNWLLIDLLWVEDSLRGKGVGSSLLQAAEDAARDYGAKRVFLNTGFLSKARLPRGLPAGRISLHRHQILLYQRPCLMDAKAAAHRLMCGGFVPYYFALPR